MVAVFRTLYRSNEMCIQSNPGPYDEGMAYCREAMTKITSYGFWYLGCWSKGQTFPKKLDDPYIWTEHYLTADPKRLLVFPFSISTLSHFQLFSAFRTEVFYAMTYPRVALQPYTCTRLTAAATASFLHAAQLTGFSQSVGSAIPSHSRTRPALQSFELQAPFETLALW